MFWKIHRKLQRIGNILELIILLCMLLSSFSFFNNLFENIFTANWNKTKNLVGIFFMTANDCE